MERRMTADTAPALGDIRQMGHGDTVWLSPGVDDRGDWGRYLDALASAVTRGTDVRWVR